MLSTKETELNANEGSSASPTPPSVKDLCEAVIATLEEHKAEDIININLKGKTSIADNMIIASGRSGRQVAAIAHYLIAKIKELGFPPPATEGLPQGDWVLVDTGDIIIHIFRPEVREFYNLEKMWSVAVDGEKAE